MKCPKCADVNLVDWFVGGLEGFMGVECLACHRRWQSQSLQEAVDDAMGTAAKAEVARRDCLPDDAKEMPFRAL